MPILEKLTQTSQARHWTDSIPLEYHYTAGVAGEEFRRKLRDEGTFLATKCPKCKTTYLPARMFCPSCFVETGERVIIDKPGYVYSLTTVSTNRSGQKTTGPTTVVLVKFDDVTGGIVHRMELDEPDEAEVGMRVEPVLKEREERTGALTDIVGFRPKAARR